MGGVGHTGRVEYTEGWGTWEEWDIWEGEGHLGGVGQLGFEASVQRQWLCLSNLFVCAVTE